ncbi:MAG: hypothetical protein KF744_12200 [Taibaiella sp.]|nr:hypothetical protein [Taibaiella sp.]
MPEQHYLVPSQSGGEQTDIVYHITTEFVEDAEDLFVDAKDRLLEVNKWATFAGFSAVSFALADAAGHALKRRLHRHDHIVISSPAGGTADRFTVDALEYDDYPDDDYETFAIRMHLSDQDPEVAKSSTIVVARHGRDLSAIYHGRNKTDALDELWHGLKIAEWEALVKGFIESVD